MSRGLKSSLYAHVPTVDAPTPDIFPVRPRRTKSSEAPALSKLVLAEQNDNDGDWNSCNLSGAKDMSIRTNREELLRWLLPVQYGRAQSKYGADRAHQWMPGYVLQTVKTEVVIFQFDFAMNTALGFSS